LSALTVIYQYFVLSRRLNAHFSDFSGGTESLKKLMGELGWDRGDASFLAAPVKTVEDKWKLGTWE
jgi:hypothetical protein